MIKQITFRLGFQQIMGSAPEFLIFMRKIKNFDTIINISIIKWAVT